MLSRLTPCGPRSLLLLTLLAALRASAASVEVQPFARPAAAPTGAPLYEQLYSAAIGLTVPNEYGDPRMWGERFREFTLGALETGLAVADFFGDGRPAIFAVSKTGPCALYRQTAPYQFTDVAAAAGVTCTADAAPRAGATAVDINQDGRPDLYVCRYDAPNLLFVNNGDGTFTERAKEYGLDVRDACVMASFADYDGDGDLDCFLLTNILDFSRSPLGQRSRLLRNDGGRFTDVSRAAGIWGLGQGHAALWFDADGDHWPDLYVANDFETPDRFYLNRRNGTFADVVDLRLPHVTYFSMGVDSGDLNNDGRTDFIVTDMRDRSHTAFLAGLEEAGRGLWEIERAPQLIPQYMWNTVYLNTGTPRYEEAAHLTGMAATGWTWSVRLADLDHDGRQDVLYTAGMIRNFVDPDLIDRQNVAPNLRARAAVWKDAPPRREPLLAFRNDGALHFTEVGAAWGLARPGIAFACALVDLTGTGHLDVIISNQDGPPTVFRHRGAPGASAIIRLVGRAPNRDAIGAAVRLETDHGAQVRQLYGERGAVTSEPAVAHFGLGAATRIRRLEITWPDGTRQVLEDLPVNARLTIEQPAAAGPVARPAVAAAEIAALYREEAAARGLDFTSRPAAVDEFTRQPLLPRRLHAHSPVLAQGDFDGDGRPDVFVGGTTGDPATLFLAQPDGRIARAAAQPWARIDGAETLGAAFFPHSGGTSALFLTRAGPGLTAGHAALGGELYVANRAGVYEAVPAVADLLRGHSLGACAVIAERGEPALLFAGGRSVPGRWPETPRSFLLLATASGVTEVTAQLAPELASVGLVTAAATGDFDGDGRTDLAVATEWGTVRVFLRRGSGFTDATARLGLAAHTGWWSALAVADVDGDGRLDLIAGNVGLNTKYHASSAAPTVLFAGDLDGSGKFGLVEAQTEEGALRTVRGREKLAQSFPWIRKKFPTFAAFSRASVSEIFGAEALARVARLEANTLASGVFRQRADGTFGFEPLPREAQLAPINALVFRDLDGDGRADLFVAGNHFGPEPSTGRFDGGLGLLLSGDGRGGFQPVLPGRSGLVVPGEARGAVALPDGTVVVSRSRGELLCFRPVR